MAKVLVIDDHYGMRKTIRDILEDAGHEVLEAPDGQSGVQIQRRNKADLVITDIFMPHQEGMSTIRELSLEDPALPIIAMSGGSRDLTAPEGFIKLARRFGARGVLAKPFQIEDLLSEVVRLLSERNENPAPTQ